MYYKDIGSKGASAELLHLVLLRIMAWDSPEFTDISSLRTRCNGSWIFKPYPSLLIIKHAVQRQEQMKSADLSA